MDYCSFIRLCSNGWIINIAEYRFPVRSYESDILISFPGCRSNQRNHLPAGESVRAWGPYIHASTQTHTHSHTEINRLTMCVITPPPHTHRLDSEGQRMLSPSTAQALQSPFEDFKNHLGLLSIFVKQVNLRATVQ